MSPEHQGPELEDQPGAGSQQEQYRNLGTELAPGARVTSAVNVGPTLEQSIQEAHQQATKAASEASPELSAAVEALSDREKALIFEAVKMAETAEADFDRQSGHLPTWLKTAAKSASIGAIGSVAIGVAENYAHARGWHMLPADNSVGEAWFMLVNAYYTSRAWANRNVTNLKSKMGQ